MKKSSDQKFATASSGRLAIFFSFALRVGRLRGKVEDILIYRYTYFKNCKTYRRGISLRLSNNANQLSHFNVLFPLFLILLDHPMWLVGWQSLSISSFLSTLRSFFNSPINPPTFAFTLYQYIHMYIYIYTALILNEEYSCKYTKLYKDYWLQCSPLKLGGQ